MSVKLRRWLGDDRGTSAIEFAIALPTLILLIAGMGQFAWFQHCSSSLRYALTSSSRALLLNPAMTESAYVTLVKSKLGAADPNVTVSLSVANFGGRKVATATGAYANTINLVVAPAMPLNYRTSVQTSLPAM